MPYTVLFMFGHQHMQVDSHRFRASEKLRDQEERTKFPCEFSRRVQLGINAGP